MQHAAENLDKIRIRSTSFNLLMIVFWPEKN